MRGWISAILLGGLCLSSVDAWAQEGEPGGESPGTPSVEQTLSSLREMILMARYDEVGEPARQLLERGDLTAPQRIAALEVRALLEIAQRDTQAAEGTIAEIYSRDPGHRLSDPDASPVVIEAFERARADRGAPVPVQMEHEVDVVEGDDPVVRIRVMIGTDAVVGLRLRYRQESEVEYAEIGPRLRDGAARARIPVRRDDRGSRLAFYFEALAPSGAALASVGSAEEPLWIELDRESDGGSGGGGGGDGGGGILSQWWFWTAVGVVVAGAVVGTVLIASSGSETEGSLGSGVLR